MFFINYQPNNLRIRINNIRNAFSIIDEDRHRKSIKIHQGIDDGKIDDSISFDVIFNWIQIIILAFEKNG